MKLIIDTDPGDDDIIAILLALSWPDTQVLAYIASFGNVDVEHTYNNLLKLYGVLDKQIKLHPESLTRFQSLKHVTTLIKGAAGPIEGSHPGDGAFFHGTDGLGNISTRYPTQIPLPDPASLSHLLKIADTSAPYYDHILDVLSEQEDGSVIWVVLGPLSSLALALRHGPDLVKRKVGKVCIMGGAIDMPGNASAVAEWNIFADVFAAHEVFKHSRTLPIYLTPLDIVTKHTLSWPDYRKYVDPDFYNSDSPSADPLTYFTSAFFRWTKIQTEKWSNGEFQLIDPCSMWFTLSNLSGGPLDKKWPVKSVDIRIERLGEYTRGMCVVDNRETPTGLNEAGDLQSRDKLLKEIEHSEKSSSAEDTNNIFVLTATPGSEALVDAIFEHVWGVQRHKTWYTRLSEMFSRFVDTITKD